MFAECWRHSKALAVNQPPAVTRCHPSTYELQAHSEGKRLLQQPESHMSHVLAKLGLTFCSRGPIVLLHVAAQPSLLSVCLCCTRCIVHIPCTDRLRPLWPLLLLECAGQAKIWLGPIETCALSNGVLGCIGGCC
jgi:hypothetical protein